MKLVGLGDSCSAYLAEFATELAQHGVIVPDAVYVASGEIPWDGESLILSLGSASQGIPGHPTALSQVSPSTAISAVSLYVELIRVVSTFGYEGGRIGLPSEHAMDTEGVRSLNDAGAMIQTAIILKSRGVPVSLGVDYSIGQCVPIGPMGGLAAVRLALDISIDGA